MRDEVDASDGSGHPDQRRDRTVLLASFVVFGWLAVLDRAGDIIHLRGLSLIQSAAAIGVVLGGAAAAYLASEFGPWSWLSPVRRLQRDGCFALFALAAVFTLDRIAASFR